jgi:hypothetical protein
VGELKCSKCKGVEWKSAKMVMLEGASVSDGTANGRISQDGLHLFGSDNYRTQSSIKMASTTNLAKAVEAMVKKEREQLKKPSAPVEPKFPQEPSRPWRDRPPAIQWEFKPPVLISRRKMWWNRRSAGLGGITTIILAISVNIFVSNPKAEPNVIDHLHQNIASIWMPYGVIVLAIFIIYLFSGSLGLKEYNAKREQKARRIFDISMKKKRAENESLIARYEEYDADLAVWESEKSAYLEELKTWKDSHLAWELTVADIEAQRLALEDQLRVCLKCAHVYKVQDPSASGDTGEEGLASVLGESARKAAGASADAIKDLAGRTSDAASDVGNKINDIFNRDASE